MRARGGGAMVGRRGAVALGFLAAWIFSVGAAAAQMVRVTPLARDGRILISFELADAFTDEMREVIRSGLQTTFTYEVELRRAATLWFDRTIVSAQVSASVRYDTLTRRYQVSRMQDGHVEESHVYENEDDVQRQMTAFERLPLFSTAGLEPNGEYYVRVRARTHPRNTLFFLPWDRDAASGRAQFTFIP